MTNIKRLVDVLNYEEAYVLGGELAAPMVNINGTSARMLVADYLEATNKLHEAAMQMLKLVPNGRDYPSRPDLLDRATRQHRLRHAAIQAVIEEILALAERAAASPGWSSVEA